MQFLKDYWAVAAATAGAWLSRIRNETLQKIVSLLTILVIVLGLLDWGVRKIRGRVRKQKPGGDILEKIEGTQKPFKTVNMLDNPIEPGEKIGNFVDKISKDLNGGKNMKKFFKWLWYNKEQLGSILYSAAIITLSQIVIWKDLLWVVLPILPATGSTVVKVAIGLLSVGFTVLTVRNVCVKYGLSSLDTIDKVLAEKAQAATNKLTTEQKKALKANITTLQQTLEKNKAELTEHEKTLAEITTLFTADSTLVPDYARKKAELNAHVAHVTAVIANIEAKIAEYKAQLDGKTEAPKA